MRRYILAFIGIFIFALAFYGDAIAVFFWRKQIRADIALTFIREDSKLALDIGNYYFNVGAYDLDISVRAYEKALKLNNNILWGHYQLARVYFVKGEFPAAIKEINKELEANPTNLRSLYVRGLIFGAIGELEKAEEDFRRFIIWAPSEWAGYNDLAWILAKEGKYEDVLDVIEIAFMKLSEKDKNAWLWNSKGVAELNLKKYKEAVVTFQKAKELADALTLTEWRTAYPGNNPGELEGGLEVFKKAIEKNLLESSRRNR